MSDPTCPMPRCGKPSDSSDEWCHEHLLRLLHFGTPWDRSIPENRHYVREDGVGVLVITRRDMSIAEVLYDVADHNLIASMKWHIDDGGYAAAPDYTRPTGRKIPLHSLLSGLKPGDPRRTDHINGDRADDRRSNLRVTSHQDNIANQAIVNHRGASRFRNVYPKRGRWQVRIKAAGRVHCVGSFDTEDEAAAAAAAARIEFGLPIGY